MPRERVPLRFARMLEARSPRLAALVAVPRITGATRATGAAGQSEVWTPVATHSGDAQVTASTDHPSPRILIVADQPVSARWLAASISTALAAEVVTARPHRVTAAELAVDAIVGLGSAAGTAVSLCRTSRAGRLALISPLELPTSVPSGLPTTLIQASASGPQRPKVQEFERTLRATGTAVRDTDYPSTADEWVRLPRLVRGSTAALGDLVAFLERGIGVQSTFEVIPGWDLH